MAHQKPFYTPRMEWSKLNVRGWTPGAREGHSAVEIDGRMYVFGGIERGQRVNSTVVLDSSLGDEGVQWYQQPASGDLPPPRCFHASWAVGPHLFVHGGECASVLDGRVSHGTSGAHSERQEEALEPLDEADRPKRICTDSMFALDTTTGEWMHLQTRLSPLPRKGHAAVVLAPEGTEEAGGGGGMVVIFGGAPSSMDSLFGDVHSVDIADLGNRAIWAVRHMQGSAPCPRHSHSMVASGAASALVFGGMDVDGALLGDLHSLDAAGWSWHEVHARGKPPAPRFGHSATALRGQMVLFGGVVQGDDGRKTFSRELFVYNFEANAWAEVIVGHAFPGPRYGHTIACGPGNSVLVFGGLHSMYCTSDTWQLRMGRGAKTRTQPLTRQDRLGLDPAKVADVEAVIMEARRDMLHVEQQLIQETRARVELAATIDDMRTGKERAELELLRVQEESRLKIDELRQELATAHRLAEQLAAEKEEAYELLGLLELSANLRLSAWREHAKGQVLSASASGASLGEGVGVAGMMTGMSGLSLSGLGSSTLL